MTAASPNLSTGTAPANPSALRIHVAGIPVPQGSLKAVPIGRGRHAVIPNNKRELMPWRKAMKLAAEAAAAAAGWSMVPLTVPVDVELTFWMPRPPSVSRRRAFPSVRPDLDKCVRAALDAMTDAGVYADDGQVVHLQAWQRYAPAGHRPGLVIEVAAVSS